MIYDIVIQKYLHLNFMVEVDTCVRVDIGIAKFIFYYYFTLIKI